MEKVSEEELFETIPVRRAVTALAIPTIIGQNKEKFMKTWLITGCSTGLGKSLAKAVLNKGDCAMVTARDEDTLNEFAEKFPETAMILALDVTDQKAIEDTVKKGKTAVWRH